MRGGENDGERGDHGVGEGVSGREIEGEETEWGGKEHSVRRLAGEGGKWKGKRYGVNGGGMGS